MKRKAAGSMASLPGLTRQSRAAATELTALDARLTAGHDGWVRLNRAENLF